MGSRDRKYLPKVKPYAKTKNEFAIFSFEKPYWV
jgi:hypothetical protein